MFPAQYVPLIGGVLFMVFLLSSCRQSLPDMPVNLPYTINYPPGFPPMNIPPDKELTLLRVELGKKLFFDKRLSRDSTVSCGSCHLQQHAFADPRPKSVGTENRIGFRNAPTLTNIGYHPYLFRDGGATTLETQILAPIQDENEMNFSVPEAVARLSQIPEYAALAWAAYQRPFDAFVLTRAIAAFERTLLSGNSRYDQFINGNASALNESEIRGMNLFFSNKTQCSQCHSGFDFTNYDFKNIGLYETYADTGRERITLNPTDKGKFKTPTLRNVAVTAPYMHDGSLATLEEVIEHFNSGGKNHPNKDPLIRPLHLTSQEKTDLVNFLKALTDETFLHHAAFHP